MWVVILVNIFSFGAITGRMVTSSALTSAVPALPDRGAYMAINSSIQQVSGGIASALAGLIVVQATPTSRIEHFDTLGYVVVGAMIVTLGPMWIINRQVQKQQQQQQA
jgi:hypothetical protein